MKTPVGEKGAAKGVSVRNSWRYSSGDGKTRGWIREIETNADEILVA
jgi:hypothetical protein